MRGVDPEPSSGGSDGASEPVPIAGLPAVAVPLGGPKKGASKHTDDDAEKPGCWGSVNPGEQAGYGVCAEPQPALATRSASVGGSSAGTVGDGVAPDDPSVYTPVAELKARELKELRKAKADPAAAYEKWLVENKKTYAAVSPMGQAVFAEFLKVIDLGLKHNSDPDTTYACGSCWTYSSTAVIEAQASTPTAKAPYLSTQQLVDCAISAPEVAGVECNGCQGGFPQIAFSYAKTQGILLETDYPYASSDFDENYDPIRKTCRSSAYTNNQRMFISSYQRISSDEQVMLDHAVAIVGYGVQNGVDYWLVRNSWGPTWGDPAFPGHIRFQRGVGLIGFKYFDQTIRVFAPYTSGGAKPSPPPPPSPPPSRVPSAPSPPPPSPVVNCATSTLWADGRDRARGATEYGYSWAVAVTTTNCAKYGYAYDYDNTETAETEAVAACSNYHGTPCTAVASGTNECRNATWINELQNIILGYASTSQPYYAVAVDGNCENAAGIYGSDYYNVLSKAVKNCNASARSDPLVTSTNPCDLVVSGSKAPAKCTDSYMWSATLTQAIQATEWGLAYAVFADPRCGNQWYEYNWDTLDQARSSTEALASCTAASVKAGMGPCSLVASGVAKCTRPSAWSSSSYAAYLNTDYGNYWGVWADKLCEDIWYDYNWDDYEDMLLNNESLDLCNQAALDKGWSANSCGMVDSGTG
ncbi:hypothetical protein HYH03_009517 [Edaphochlamys debaryana]|uniref:Peptidase C1A papain C-terminal domain-containing protein n=1 Tax=Edaphochlamys debaryana TaxID=47281 RepID=A0A835XZ54_9CHLO|nr:hypothetical protein HYH03_009517 [Edaphochlamys debaryana]|eukprot:KAG2492277.1 hypothetical protein HYH03_009517 [Edaphochlamys debaryana]